MKILFNKEGLVDLENPVYMDEDQREQFIDFLGRLLGEKIEIRNVKEKERFIQAEEGKIFITNLCRRKLFKDITLNYD
jgi:ribosome biogenesis GTPase A